MESTIKLYFKQSYPFLVFMGIILCELLFIPRASSDLYGLIQLSGSPMGLYWITLPVALLLILIALPKSKSGYFTILFFVLFPILAQIIHWLGGFGALLAGGVLFGYVRLLRGKPDKYDIEPDKVRIILYIIFGLFILSKLVVPRSSIPDLILVLVFGGYMTSYTLINLFFGFFHKGQQISGFPMLLPLSFSGLLIVLLLVGTFPGASGLTQTAALESESVQSETVVEAVENPITTPEAISDNKEPVETQITEKTADKEGIASQDDQKVQTQQPQPAIDNTPKEPLVYNVNASWNHEGKFLVVNKVIVTDDATEVEFTFTNKSEYNAMCSMFLRKGSDSNGYYIRANGKKYASISFNGERSVFSVELGPGQSQKIIGRFEPLPRNTRSIEIIEGSKGANDWPGAVFIDKFAL